MSDSERHIETTPMNFITNFKFKVCISLPVSIRAPPNSTSDIIFPYVIQQMWIALHFARRELVNLIRLH